MPDNPPASRTFLQACSFIIRDGLFGWAFVWMAQINYAVRPLLACLHQLDELSGAVGPVSRGLLLKLNGQCVDRHMDHQQHGCTDTTMVLGANIFFLTVQRS